MISFDPFYLLLIVLFVNFIPGALLSFSILKEKKLFFVEKLFIGFAIGLVLPTLIPFILAIVNIPFSFAIAVLTTLLFYIFAVYFAIKEKPWEDYSSSINLKINRNRLISILLIVIVLLSFWIRMQSYSPIYFDLDPYYYIYSATQIVTLGIPPLNDQTAWYPDVIVDHRNVPALSYLESIWYSFYTGGGEYNNYLLADVASFYPPIMAMLAVFFLYLFISSVYKREFGLIAAAVASFLPILLMKLAASEFEVQAYAFFALAFFYSMYALSLEKKDLKYILLASLGLASVYLGSASIILAVAALILFIPLQSLFLFFRREKEELFAFFKLNAIIFVLGFLLPTILMSLYKSAWLIIHLQFAVLAMVLFSGILYLIKDKVKDMKKVYTYAGVFLLVSILVLFFTPLGTMILTIGKGGLSIAEFTTALSRTIQEQAETDDNFVSMLGFMGAGFTSIFNSAFSALTGSSNQGVAEFLSLIFLPFSFISNLILGAAITISNIIFGTSLNFTDKPNSPMMFVLFFTIVFILYSLKKDYEGKEYTLPLLFLAVLFPPILIGLLKQKYTIYAGFMFAAAFGFVLGEAYTAIPKLIEKLKSDFDLEKCKQNTLKFLLILGVLVVVLQFFYSNVAPGVLFSSTQIRFQDNPMALQPKFQELCTYLQSSGSSDATIVCAAAQDPEGFASLGTNYQYHSTLCLYSLIDAKSNSISDWDIQAYQYRCLRLNDYWIDSMEWIKNSQDETMRVTSWWDYGHWINFFGEKNTVLRNEHASPDMIEEVAHNYISGTPEELKQFMLSHDSKYVLFDSELISSGTGFGGKFGALNYLSCAWSNGTDVSKTYMQSACEWDHLWESVYVPTTESSYYQECTISSTTGEKGIVSYVQEYTLDSSGIATSSANPYYCLGTTTLIDGTETLAFYYLNEKYENGDLKLNKGFLILSSSDSSFDLYNVAYTKDALWVENGAIVSGWEDRKGAFYDSNLYNGFFLEQLDGFELVFESNSGNVKIFKISE